MQQYGGGTPVGKNNDMKELLSHFFDDEPEEGLLENQPVRILPSSDISIDWNDDFYKAWQALVSDEPCVFVTGPGGVGKSFMLRLFLKGRLNAICAASTGVAALNVGGHTAHSLFRLPATLCLPHFAPRSCDDRHYNQIRQAEFLVLDEVSMIRADVLDLASEVCKRARCSYEPFGGLKVRLFGDCFQLPPILRDEEKNEWNANFSYESPYFFDASVIKFDFMMKTFPLRKIYRQNDPDFIALLHRIRLGEPADVDIRTINARKVLPEETTVVLCPTNKQADHINSSMLASLETKEYVFDAMIEGSFPPNFYPVKERLVLKEGARVMFRKNDAPDEDGGRNFTNGDTGEIVKIGKDSDDDFRRLWITVKLDRNQREIKVSYLKWERYEIVDKKKKMTGSFTQVPLMLGWAHTSHKAQGLSFDKMHLADSRMFAPHQFYVIASRVRSLEGFTLSKPISAKSIWVDPRVVKFYQEALQ